MMQLREKAVFWNRPKGRVDHYSSERARSSQPKPINSKTRTGKEAVSPANLLNIFIHIRLYLNNNYFSKFHNLFYCV